MKLMLTGVSDIHVYPLKDHEEKSGLRMNR